MLQQQKSEGASAGSRFVTASPALSNPLPATTTASVVSSLNLEMLPTLPRDPEVERNLKIAIYKLNFGLLCGSALFATMAGSVLAVTLSYITQVQSGWGLLVPVSLTLLSTWKNSIARERHFSKLKDPTEQDLHANFMKEELPKLAAKCNMDCPKLKTLEPKGFVAMASSNAPCVGNVICVNESDISEFSANQKRFLLAHELSHFNRVSVFMGRPVGVAKTLVATSIVYAGVLNAFSGEAIFMSLALAYWGANFSISLMNLGYRFMQRPTEIKTDLLAVHLTKDPEGACEAFDVLNARRSMIERGIHKRLVYVLSHPTEETRKTWIRKVFCTHSEIAAQS